MCDSGTVAAIDDYLSGLDRRLAGPRRIKADLLAEARDSLIDARSALVEGGLDAAAAERRAIADFGAYPDIAPAYQAELTISQGRRTALVVVLALPVLHLLAPLMWLNAPWDGPKNPDYFTLAAVFDYLSLSGAVMAGLVLLGFGRGHRFAPDGVRLTRWFGAGTLVFMAVHGLAGAVIITWSLVQWPKAMTWPPMLVGVAVMWLSYAYAAGSGWRCVRLGRTDPTGTGSGRDGLRSLAGAAG